MYYPSFNLCLQLKEKERLEKTENTAVRNIIGDPPQPVMKRIVSSFRHVCN